MKTKVEKFTFLAKIARNVACLSAFFALSASADDVRTLGYATSGVAAALPAAPDMGGTVVNVTAAQAQYVLDGAYGSIDGKTINFTESVADTLVLGRASKYAGSGTLYRHGKDASTYDSEAMSYEDFIAYKNQATWTEGCYYERTVENVTFTADAGVVVNFTAEGGAHVYGTESAPVYDYVRDTGTWIRDTNNSFYKRAILKNITFQGLTFKAKTNFETSESTTVFDGFTFTGCAFETGSSTDTENQALRYYNENNNGNVRNLVVENCTFRNCYQGVYTHHVKGITVKDCTFETTGHNAIAIQSTDGKGACDHGAVVITGNTFKNIGDRIIRFNMVGAGTTITIADNTADGNSGKLLTGKREIVAATSLPENAAEIITASNNDWGANAVAEGVFAEAKPVVTGVTVSGIAGFEGKSFETFAAAYAAIKPTVEKLGLGQEGATAEQFDALFTAVDANGDATITYTISGNVVYDETGCENLLSMGRRASHYGNGRHLINFKFIGKTGKDADTLTINSNLTLPYEWWSEKKETGIHFENLTLTGSAPNGLYAYQSYFEGIDFSVASCILKGLKIYNCSNVSGSYSITDSVLDGTDASANSYAIHLQGNETAPLAITIKGNTITGYDRGINIDQKTAVATISENTISVNDAGRSCIQLTQLAETTVSGNTLNLTGGNAITLHEKLLGLVAAPKISVTGNTVEGKGYLVYDDAAANGKAFTADNLALTYGTDNTVAETVDTTKGVKGSTVVSTSVAVNNVIQHYVATVGETGYASLADALAAAKDGDVVDLLANATVSDYVLDKGVTIRSAGETRYEIKGLKAIAGSGVTLENVFLNLDQTLDIGGTDTTLKNCAMRAKDVGYWDIVDGKTTGFTGGTAYQGNAYTYLVRVSGTRVSLTDCLIDGTDNKESYFPNMCLAPVTGTDVTMTRCTFNEGYAACYYSTPRGTWTLEDCTFTKIFCYNIQAGDTAAKIVVKGCSLAGWTSFGSSMTEVSFEDCAFAKSSGYATIVAYKNATFSGCTFTEDYKDNLFVEANTAVDLNGCSVVGGDGQPSATVSLAGIVELDDGTAFAALDATKDENGKYTAGTFVGSADAVRAAVAEGRALKTDADGSHSLVEAVAQIGSVGYASLAEAIAAAKDGETVTLLADAELTAAQTIAQTLVLDLNGKAIRSTVDKFLVIAKGGDLTVNDATNEGRIENTAEAFWACALEMKGGVLTVNGGTIAANTATSSYSPTITVATSSSSTINLAGGRIEAIRTANHAQGVIELGAEAKATLNVTGGEIVGSGTGIRSLVGNEVNVSGGTIVGQTGNAVYSSRASVLALTGGLLESKGASVAFGMGTGNSAVTIGREGGSASDVMIPSMDFDGRVVTVNLLSGTVKEFRNWTSMTVEKVSLGAATLLVGTDISTKLPGSNLLCQKDAASGLYEVVELTAENAAATVLHDGVETPYNTVDQAQRAVTDGDTLTLKVDHEGSLAFTAQNVTVDFGGKTLTGASNSHALSFNQSAAADNRVTVKNGTIIAKGQDAACIRATSGDAAKTLTVVLGDGLTLTAGSNNRSGRVVLAKGARTAAPCADVNNGGLRVTEDGTDWIYGETETAFIHANGAEVTLLNDWYSVDYDGTIKVPETAAFASAKLNLGGHTVKAYGGAAIVMGDDAKPAEGAATKSLEISNGVILTSSHGAAVCGSNKTLVLDGVQLTTTGDGKFGLYANGMTSGNAVTLKNGSALTAEQGTGLYFPGAGTLTVADSAVTGAKSGIEIRAGVLNVSGTSEIASTAESFSFENDDNGVTTTGAAVAAVKHTVGNDLTVNISGGTFKGPRGFYANDPNPTTGGSVAVAISGGTFSTAVLSEHCAAGYEPVTNADGTYGVRATFAIAAVKVSADSDKTIDIRVPYALLENVAGETQEEKVANLSKADENGNLAWVNLVAGIDSAKKVTMTAPQNNEPDVIDVDLPTVGEAPEGTDVTVRYEIRADGSEAAVVSAEDVEDLVINLNGKAGIGTYRAYVCLLQNGTEVARVASENALGVLQTVRAAKKTIIAVPWLSLTDGNAIAVADLVKTAGLTAGDKLHVYNKAENRYDVYELTADKAWAPKAIYKVGADGTVETASSGTPETTTVARGSGVWIERQDTTQLIVSYGAVASATVATTIDEGTAEKPTWNLLAVPTTTAINLAATFGTSETDEIIVPTDGAPKVCTVKDGAWGYDKSVPVTDESGNQLGVTVVPETVTELPAGTGFWYLNGGAVKTVNW